MKARERAANGDLSPPIISAGPVQLVPLAEIRPAPENDKVYRPVDTTDPDFLKLRADIRANGVLDPLAITLDGLILSGHRRYAAARLERLEKIPARRVSILHSDPRFLVLLTSFNLQRVKTIDEVLREEVGRVNPAEAYAELLQHREHVARSKVQPRVIEGHQHRAAITPAKKLFLKAIQSILERMRNWWPLSDRQIHYQLLNDPPLIHASKPDSTYKNAMESYKALVRLLTPARVHGVIPWQSIHDPTRPVTLWDTFRSPGPFIRRELDNFLAGYFRDLQAPQAGHVEILVEKNTLAGIVVPVAGRYCIPLTIARGYCSLPPRYEMAQRFKKTGKDRLVLLALTDFDPEGENILDTFVRSLRGDFKVKAIDPIKVALTKAQVEELRLPPGAIAKKDSSRRKKFVKAHGEHVFELEAVEPQRLEAMLAQAIESVLDMDLFRAEQAHERDDAAYLKSVNRIVQDTLKNLPTK